MFYLPLIDFFTILAGKHERATTFDFILSLIHTAWINCFFYSIKTYYLLIIQLFGRFHLGNSAYIVVWKCLEDKK